MIPLARHSAWCQVARERTLKNQGQGTLMTAIDGVLDRLDKDLDASLERLFSLLKIPSISTDSDYAEDCEKAADWLVADLASIGFEARKMPTAGHPMVVAHHHDAPGKPTVLFYGHYDVQPVDPLNLWDSEPFEPRLVEAEDGTRRIVARGAADDKGQLMTFVEACRAWKESAGELPVNVTIFFEGEEESGSPSLIPFLKQHSDLLSADVALVCDTTMWDRYTPAISTALRGLVGEEVTIKAADRDLHSGHYGSAARNPIHLLVDMLAALHDEDGKVTLDGFYDGVPELPAEIKAQWDSLGFSESDFLGEIGLSIPAGEKGRSVLEMTWSRPTCEINGIYGGYTGKGFKTVIPAEASGKVSFRLVGDQDPEKIRASFRQFIRDRLPADCSADFHEHGGSGAIQLDYNSPQLSAAAEALKDEWDKDAALIAMGGSIPVVGLFQSMLGTESLLIGFSLDDDRIHSPNEKYEMSSFHRGARSWARVLEALNL